MNIFRVISDIVQKHLCSDFPNPTGMMEKMKCEVRSIENGVRGTACRVCLSSVSSDFAVIFMHTPSFPLYGAIKWKTRSLSLKYFFRRGGDF